MKKEATQHLRDYLNRFGLVVEELHATKIKQSNNKPAYAFSVQGQDCTLYLAVAKNNDNQFVINQDVSSYNISDEDFLEMVKQRQQLKKKVDAYQQKPAKTYESERKEKDNQIDEQRKLKFR